MLTLSAVSCSLEKAKVSCWLAALTDTFRAAVRLLSSATQTAARWAAGSSGQTVPRPRSRGRTERSSGRWRTFQRQRCCGSPSWSTLWGSEGRGERIRLQHPITELHLEPSESEAIRNRKRLRGVLPCTVH